MQSHAANPVPEDRGNGMVRIYFSTRDTLQRSSIAWIEIDMKDPARVTRVADTPILTPGLIGSFDDSGCSMGCIVRSGTRRLLYYMGWNLGVTVPWRNSIGLAISDGEDSPFERASIAPIMDRCTADPYTISYPCVIGGGNKWRMWYGSNLSWGASDADMDHMIKYAESDDGIEWRRDGKVVLGSDSPEEYAFARPWVTRDHYLYRMWYAFRGSAYRIGYAESVDGISWTRRDVEAGLDVSLDGWDSLSIEYPSVFDHEGRRYMLYCGNGYGKTGFGLAILDR